MDYSMCFYLFLNRKTMNKVAPYGNVTSMCLKDPFMFEIKLVLYHCVSQIEKSCRM